MTATTSNTHITHVGTVIVPTNDQDAALAFYTEKLGFEKRLDVPYGEGQRWIEVAPPGAQTVVAIAPPPPGASAGNADMNTGLATDDADASHAELKARGVDVDDEVMRLGDPVPPMFWFRDPEGNRFLIVERND